MCWRRPHRSMRQHPPIRASSHLGNSAATRHASSIVNGGESNAFVARHRWRSVPRNGRQCSVPFTSLASSIAACRISTPRSWTIGTYHCSMSTMYRILHGVGEVGERRDQATRPAHVKPELCATAPRQVFAWDITKLHGPQKWTYYYFYAVIDIYSRRIVGWMVADRESSALARFLLSETIIKEHADPSNLTVHSDRGSSMTSKPVAFLLADLGVTKSHSRPHVSDDNPHIESFFKTAKYQPEFPATFANIVEAREFCRIFVRWYNTQHRHSALALLTPNDVHYGRAPQRLNERQRIMDAAYGAHPERFVHGKPKVRQLPIASYINRPHDAVDNSSETLQMRSFDHDCEAAITDLQLSA